MVFKNVLAGSIFTALSLKNDVVYKIQCTRQQPMLHCPKSEDEIPRLTLREKKIPQDNESSPAIP